MGGEVLDGINGINRIFDIARAEFLFCHPELVEGSASLACTNIAPEHWIRVKADPSTSSG
jgi:hypothetical protein